MVSGGRGNRMQRLRHLTLMGRLWLLMTSLLLTVGIGAVAVNTQLENVEHRIRIVSEASEGGGPETHHLALDAVSAARIILAGTVITIVVIGGIVALLARRNLVGRIKDLVFAASQVAAGNMSGSVDASGSDEIAELAFAFNEMIRRRRIAEERLQDSLGELASQNERLREVDRLKDEFVATMSHELRTPLTALVAYPEILLEGDPGPLTEEQRRFLSTMDRSAQRLRRMVDDLLLLARMDTGRFQVQPSEVSLGSLSAEVVSDSALVAQRKGVQLYLDARSDMVLCADRARLAQLVDNLISNALRFTPPGGRVDVLVDRLPDRAVVEVRNDGPGIDPADLDKVFDRFHRGKNAQPYEGSGVGLTIVKAVAEAHGGTVNVTSRPGEETTFRVEIPLEGADAVNVPTGVSA